MAIEFTDEDRKRIFDALQSYVQEHFEHDIGLLQTEKLFDFLMGMLGATIYNQAIEDAQAYMQAKVIDMEIDLHQVVEYGGRA